MPGWIAALETINGLVNLGRRLRAGSSLPEEAPAVRSGGALEARLAGVVVAALKEAFDRDHQRLDLERARMDDERHRAEAALRAELARQDMERAAAESRTIAVAALAVLLGSLVAALWLPGPSRTPMKVLLGSGWVALIASLAMSFSYRRAANPGGAQSVWAPRLLVVGVALTLAAILYAI
jgi:hypothetical protein